MPKVKLPADLYQRAGQAAIAAGYCSAEELIHHAVEKEIRRWESPAPTPRPEMENKLQGLGYL